MGIITRTKSSPPTAEAKSSTLSTWDRRPLVKNRAMAGRPAHRASKNRTQPPRGSNYRETKHKKSPKRGPIATLSG